MLTKLTRQMARTNKIWSRRMIRTMLVPRTFSACTCCQLLTRLMIRMTWLIILGAMKVSAKSAEVGAR